MDQVKIFKGYLPQILLGPLLNTLTHIFNASLWEVKERFFFVDFPSHTATKGN